MNVRTNRSTTRRTCVHYHGRPVTRRNDSQVRGSQCRRGAWPLRRARHVPHKSRPCFDFKPTPKSPQARRAALEFAGHLAEKAWGKQPGGKHFESAPTRWTAEQRFRRTLETADPWFELWIAERKKKGYTSTQEDEAHFEKYISQVIAGPVKEWTVDDLRALARDLDGRVQAEECSWKKAWNVWGTATKMCGDACNSKIDALRVRTDNPSTGVEGPDRGPEKAKQYLYPSEFLQFVRSPDVPLQWKRAVALATYLFPRASELRVLPWDDVDLEHGTIYIHRGRDRNTGEESSTKTEKERRFSIEPALLPLLRAMHAESRGKGAVIELWSERNMASGFRRWLARAGVTRAELHSSSRTRVAIRFHDLRATGLTWMAVRGDDPLKIMHRAGHTNFKTTQIYVREAEAVRLWERVSGAPTGAPRASGEFRRGATAVVSPIVHGAARASNRHSSSHKWRHNAHNRAK